VRSIKPQRRLVYKLDRSRRFGIYSNREKEDR
jgi:hypothetical protein